MPTVLQFQIRVQENKLYTFVVDEGCSDWLSSSDVGLKNSFLQSSPEYLTITDYATVDYVKETVFRKYDTNPRDGKLSYDELYNAFLTHDVDSSYMTKELTEWIHGVDLEGHNEK